VLRFFHPKESEIFALIIMCGGFCLGFTQERMLGLLIERDRTYGMQLKKVKLGPITKWINSFSKYQETFCWHWQLLIIQSILLWEIWKTAATTTFAV